MPQYNDSQRSRSGSSDEKNRKRSGGLKDGGMPQCDDLKDQEIDQAVRKYAKDLMDSRMGVCPSVG